MAQARGIAHMKLGDPQDDALELVLLPPPGSPSPGCVLVRVTHRPINPSDHVSIATGRLLNLDQHPPILGCEGFGIIEQIGEGVTKFKPGQRVVPLIWIDYYKTGQGSWQDFVTLSEDHVVAVPSEVSDEVAAQSVINPWTVYGLLDDLAVPKGEYILQTAAASVLGRQLIQLAKHWGIKTINIVRREKWVQELKALGADEVVNSETEDMVSRVKEITGGKLAYAAVDAVGGSMTKNVASSVKDGGKVLVFGVLSGWEIRLSTLDLIRGVQVTWWILSTYADTEEKKQRTASQVMQLLQKKILTPLVGKKFCLENFKAALQESQQEGRGGKVLLIG